MPEEAAAWGGVTGALTKVFLGSPLKYWASVGHQLIWHFDLGLYNDNQKPRVIVSLAAVFAFAAAMFPALISWGGVGAVVKYWLMPWRVRGDGLASADSGRRCSRCRRSRCCPCRHRRRRRFRP